MTVDLNRLERLEAASYSAGCIWRAGLWMKGTECDVIVESEVWDTFGGETVKYNDGTVRHGDLVKTVILKHKEINDRLYVAAFDTNTNEPYFSHHVMAYWMLPDHKDMEDFIKDVESLINKSGLATTRINTP
jgi:hypothetical protein